MHPTRIGLAVILLTIGVCVATPALAEDWDAQAAERWAAPAIPTPTQGTDWVACGLEPRGSGCLPYEALHPPCGPGCLQECCPRGPWGFKVGLMGWLPGLDGNLTIDGEPHSVDFDWTDWFDVLDNIEFALQLWGQVRYEKWYFDVAGLRMVLGDSVPVQLVGPIAPTLDADLTLVLAKATVGYEVYRKSMSPDSPFPCLTTVVYAGARYYSMDMEGNLRTRLGAVNVLNQTEDWVDPLVGARVKWDLSRKWGLFVDGDVGGFGVGSDLSWHILGGVEWRVGEVFGVQFGWNHLDVDYATGSGTNQFGFDMALSGPFMNFVFSF